MLALELDPEIAFEAIAYQMGDWHPVFGGDFANCFQIAIGDPETEMPVAAFASGGDFHGRFKLRYI